MPSRIVIWSVKSHSPRFLFFLVEQNCWATMTSLSLQPDALYQLCISVAMRIAVELLWFLLLVCVFWEVSCRCVKSSLTRRLKFVRWRVTCPVENVLGLLRKGGKKSNSCLFLCVPRSFPISLCPFFPSSENWLLDCEGENKSWKSCHYVYSFWIFVFLSEISAPFQSCVSFLVTCSWNMRTYNHWLVVCLLTSFSEWSNTLQPCWKNSFKCFVHL